MPIASDEDFKRLLVPQAETSAAREWFAKREWDKIGDKVLMHPRKDSNLRPFTYDLTVGPEAWSARQQYAVLEEKKPFLILPGDSVAVLTEEFVGLPKTWAATVLPKFGFVLRGVIQNMVKIDPTWCGRLVIVLRNNANSAIPIKRGQAFSTLVLYRLETPCSEENVLRPVAEEVGLRGILEKYLPSIRKELQEVGATAAQTPEKIGQEDLDQVAKEWGPPFYHVAGIPKMVEDRISKAVQERVDDRVSYRIGMEYPTITGMVLRVISALGLVLAALALLLRTSSEQRPCLWTNIGLYAVFVAALIFVCRSWPRCPRSKSEEGACQQEKREKDTNRNGKNGERPPSPPS